MPILEAREDKHVVLPIEILIRRLRKDVVVLAREMYWTYMQSVEKADATYVGRK